MAKTAIKASTDCSGRWCALFLLFDRHVEPVDLKRCRKAFAEAAKTVFSDRGVTLETIDFESGQFLPALFDTYPYNLAGRLEVLKGKVTREQREQFCETFGRLLKKTGKYTFTVQRRTVERRSRAD